MQNRGMFPFTLQGVDARLTARYHQMVLEYTNASEKLSAGLKAIPDKVSSFASTQAAWRFYANEHITLQVLQEPLTAAVHQGIAQSCKHYALCIHDWSRLAFKHQNKTDTYAITHPTDTGYDLQSSLIINDQNGTPIGPAAHRLVSGHGSYATYYADSKAEPQTKDHLDEVCACIEHLEQQGFAKPLVHIMDREADSVFHLRAWAKKDYHSVLRVKGSNQLNYQGQAQSGQAIASQLNYQVSRQVEYHGTAAEQVVAEAIVQVTRVAKPSQKVAKQPQLPGEAIERRLVVSRVLAADGEVLAEWLLLTDVYALEASTIALWYYWRWRIESFFKLLKSAGHELEHWQQESAVAIFKRLLVTSMACVTVWQLAADQSPEAAELRAFLIKVSGRQVPKKQGFTHPALLAGLWVFLSMLEVTEHYSQVELASLTSTLRKFYARDV